MDIATYGVNKCHSALTTNLSRPCWENPFVIQPIGNLFIIVCLQYDHRNRSCDKKYKRNAKLHCWEIQFGRFWTNPLEKLLWARATSERQNKSECERNKKHPTASSVSIRFWSTHQNWFSSRNSRENSSSLYGTTRLGLLYHSMFFSIFDVSNLCTDICKTTVVQV